MSDDWSTQASTSDLSDLAQAGATNWFDGITSAVDLDVEAAKQKYGSLAKSVADYAQTRSKQAAIEGAQAVGASACLAAGAAAPLCAAVVVVMVPLIAGAIDSLVNGGPQAVALPVPVTPPAADMPVSRVELAQLINASNALAADEQRALGMLSATYADGIRRFSGYAPDADVSLAIAKQALITANYNWPLVLALPSEIDQNERAGWNAIKEGKSWDQHWQETCASERNNFLSCDPRNSIWASVDYGPGAGRSSYEAAVKEVQARIYAFPAALVKATSLVADLLAKKGLQIQMGRDRGAVAADISGKAAGSQFLTELRTLDPEKYQIMRDAIDQGEDPTVAAAALDHDRTAEIGNTGSQATMPQGAGGVGVAVLLVGGLGLLMLLAKKGGR